MPTLAAAEFQEIAYFFVIEGWSIGFTNKEALAGGAGAWIDPESTNGRRVITGLELPETITLEIGLLESGLPINDSATFGLVDTTGEIVAFMRDLGDGEVVYERLAPTDSPAPATLIGAGLSVDLHGRQIDGEQIGAAGERRMFQIFPDGGMPGYDHAAIPAQDPTLRLSTVQDAAQWLEGRPCALFILRRDPASGLWPSWSAQHAEGFALVWWGTLRAASAEAFVWSLECEGPSSWLRKTINANRVAAWSSLQTLMDLRTDPGNVENEVALCLRYLPSDDWEGFQVRCHKESYLTLSPALQTPSALAAAINAFVQTAAGTLGPDDTFSTYDQAGVVTFTEEGVKITASLENPGLSRAASLEVRMHEKVWTRIGWDMILQAREWGDISSEYELKVSSGGWGGFSPVGYGWTPDGAPAGYHTGWFTTLPAGMTWAEAGTHVDGDGVARLYRPVNPGGVQLLYPEGQQRLFMGYGGETPYNEGQLARPPADKVLDSGACTATGFLAVRGLYRESLESDAEMVYHLAKVSWAADEHSYGADADSMALAWLERWLDPRVFGAGNDALDRVWASNDLEFVPVAVLGYNLDAPDLAHVVLLRLLLSTGTAAYAADSYEGDPGAVLSPGLNASSSAASPYLAGDDMEIADLSLGIPSALIDWQSFVDAAEALPGGVDGTLARTRIALIGPTDSQELIQQVLSPRGWCFTLAGGRYGIFGRGKPLSIDDAEVSITTADIAAEPEATPPFETVSFRPLEPVDLIEVEYGGNQLGDGETKTLRVQARDPRAQLRRGNATVNVDGRTLLPDGKWSLEFSALWGDTLARWYAEPHALVTVDVKGHTGRSLWPGTVIRYTSPWPPGRDGAYGMTGRVGRITKTTLNTQTLTKTIEVLVQAGDPLSRRRFGPLARLVDGVEDSEARDDGESLFCYADAWGTGGASDVRAFAEPAWLGVGGVLACIVWQSWDGLTWEATATLDAVSVDEGASSIQYSNLTGKIWERRYGVIAPAPFEDQDPAAWPRAIFGVVCEPDGTFGAGLPGFDWSK